MADYWKSQPKKFCEYCKCWIADNKPSVEFHERGKNHQENVARKISEIKKKSLDKAKEEERIAKEFAEMENAAMKAYQEDLKRLGVNITDSSSSTTEKKPSVKVSDTQCGTKKSKANVWVEGVSPEGYTYYYNTGTGESQWEKPEGFQGSSNFVQSEVAQQNLSASSWVEGATPEGSTYFYNLITRESQWENPEGFIVSRECSDTACKDKTEPAGSAKEFITEERVEINTEDYSPGEEEQLSKDIEASIPQSETNAFLQNQNAAGDESDAKSPEEKLDTEVETTLPQDEHQQEAKKKRKNVNPYGEWEAVREEEEEQIDLQLPKVECAAPAVIDVSHEPKVKFKQKEITSLGSDAGGETVFKKRKVEKEKSRNFRRKGNDN
ncbi:WW domain-binding protein 4 isoform X1 [Amblyraja radiata]|uniref:WW domain-binding protein 4 isoform X1 n=1 Tax=Amblyraja radiata TaxID=386614 RepID=UPI0014026AB0|nr:WW domain-binding protein 4 isoform X1 [Amblyraja radiata]